MEELSKVFKRGTLTFIVALFMCCVGGDVMNNWVQAHAVDSARGSGVTAFAANANAAYPPIIIVESEQAIAIHLTNSNVDRAMVEEVRLYTLHSTDDPHYAQPVNPKAVSFRNRITNVSLRRDTVEVGSHIFLLLDQPLQAGKRYVLQVDPTFAVPFAPVQISFRCSAKC